MGPPWSDSEDEGEKEEYTIQDFADAFGSFESSAVLFGAKARAQLDVEFQLPNGFRSQLVQKVPKIPARSCHLEIIAHLRLFRL